MLGKQMNGFPQTGMGQQFNGQAQFSQAKANMRAEQSVSSSSSDSGKCFSYC